MNKIYLDCSSGISGDMTVAALLDLGADEQVLMKALDSIKAEGFTIAISKVSKSGLQCTDFDVVLDAEHDGHDHDMEYLYGHYNDGHDHHHDHETHDGHGHNHHTHHAHRGMAEINAILDVIDMTKHARELADRIFAILAQAESKAHGVPVDQVHFHEVGAIDSIVDIVAAAVCLDNLNPGQVLVSGLTEGTGTVRCQHGILPVPVPAVANIVAEYGIPMTIIDTRGELVTPTGAAIVAAVATIGRLPAESTIGRIGMGAGKRDYGLAGFVRAMEIL